MSNTPKTDKAIEEAAGLSLSGYCTAMCMHARELERENARLVEEIYEEMNNAVNAAVLGQSGHTLRTLQELRRKVQLILSNTSMTDPDKPTE
jgi:hypothetical protein